jgi:hypothetical protein
MSPFARVLCGIAILCAGATSAPPSYAADPLFSLAPGYVLEPIGWYPDFNLNAAENARLFAVGNVAAFAAPLGDLQPGVDPVEYTYMLSAPHLHWGIWDDLEHNTGGWSVLSISFYEFSEPGWIRLYRDETQNAVVGDPESFQDGELLLEAQIRQLNFEAEWCSPSAPLNAAIVFTGGSLLPLIDGTGNADGYVVGEYVSARLCWPLEPCVETWDGQIACLVTDVYLGQPVQIRPATWGELKARYR